jgi:hypothetical protein
VSAPDGRLLISGRTVLVGTVVLLGLLLGPSIARAGCGDHVRFRQPADPGATAEKPIAPPAPKPCHGPHCSGGGEQPLAPLPAPAPTGEERWGQPAAVDAFAEPAEPGRISEIDSPHPIRRMTDVFHPPRFLV